MHSYDMTALWQRALAAKVDDAHSKQRERLRVAYEAVRTLAQPLAETIAKDLPDYTVHDITHSDALWEYADLIAGPNYPLTPCEAFVLGCAFLVHDLGMGLAAYPEGLAGLKKLPLWRDTIADILRKRGVDEIDDHTIDEAAADVQQVAVGETLRYLHAARAERLALIHWTNPKASQQFHLIEDAELRDAFGPIIGRISFSHWWPVDQLAKEFVAVMGAQVGFPPSWTVNPLTLACILRCADYSHVDSRRAPAFLRALRQPTGASDDHWNFQGKLYQPRLEGDRLIFTAKSGFGTDEAGAWWVCFDTLNAIDSELRQVDSLLADTQHQRLAARGVSQADEPSRLAKLIRTDGWQPVDTRIRVSAVAELVGKLGGKDLYGDIATPPLRELIQNAADAVRARRVIDGRAADWGEIHITTGRDDSSPWIQVEDTGVGMSEAVLTGPLLDFGKSFWGSKLMHDQLPGLAAKGFQPTGRYGIGFFSVFMWGERVEISTQRFDKGRNDTVVLSFAKGLKERPLLRKARTDEHILDGGTRVKVWLSDETTLKRLRSTFDKRQELTMAQVCGRVAPCLDVTLKADGETAVTANDWLTISDSDLLKRIAPVDDVPRKVATTSYQQIPCPPLQVLRTGEGRPLGRAAIWNWQGFYTPYSKGVVTVGGLRACTLGGIVGVFVGSPRTASRDSAVPLVPLPILTAWTRSERDARLSEGHPAEVLEYVAEVVNALGVEPLGLPIAQTDSGWVTLQDIEEVAKSLDEVLLVHDAAIRLAGGQTVKPQLNRGVFAVGMGAMTILDVHPWRWLEFAWPPVGDEEVWLGCELHARSILGAVIRSLAKGWGCSLQSVLKGSPLELDEESNKEVGVLAEKVYVERVYVIRRPNGTR